MNVLLLGGNSPRHYEWIRELGDALERAGHSVILHDYAHWQSGEALANVQSEITSLRTAMSNQRDYVVVAKSIGTVIAALAVAQGALHPRKCILLGTPISGIAGETAAFAPSLAALPRTTFVQNEYDPFGSADQLDALLEATHPSSYELIVVPGNATHDYIDYELIEKLVGK